MKNLRLIFLTCLVLPLIVFAQKNKKASQVAESLVEAELFSGLKWRNIGPFRGGRSVTSSGVVGDPMTYYMGSPTTPEEVTLLPPRKGPIFLHFKPENNSASIGLSIILVPFFFFCAKTTNGSTRHIKKINRRFFIAILFLKWF